MSPRITINPKNFVIRNWYCDFKSRKSIHLDKRIWDLEAFRIKMWTSDNDKDLELAYKWWDLMKNQKLCSIFNKLLLFLEMFALKYNIEFVCKHTNFNHTYMHSWQILINNTVMWTILGGINNCTQTFSSGCFTWGWKTSGLKKILNSVEDK